MSDNESDHSDEWGEADLDLSSAAVAAEEKPSSNTDEDYWKAEPRPPTQESTPPEPGEPMILVDLTQLTNDQIHSRFDRNSVNDPEAVSKWRKKLIWSEYAQNAALLADGTVIPCGTSVWKQALVQLRNERSGHYFVPVFAPKSSS